MSAKLNAKTLGSRVSDASALTIFATVVCATLAVYLPSATYSLPIHIDPFSNVAPAWNIRTHGSVYLHEHSELVGPDYFRVAGWFREVPKGTASQYPPGAALWGAAFYAIGPTQLNRVDVSLSNDPSLGAVEVAVPVLWPAALAASLSVALAMGFFGLTIRSLSTNEHALVAAGIGAFATTAWSVAADQLWQHGPAMMWLALGTYLVSRQIAFGGGLAFAAGILTRPMTAIVSAGVGIFDGFSRRSIKRIAMIGAGAALGLGGLIAYNAVVFGSPSVLGGYSAPFSSNVVNQDLGWYMRNVTGGLLDQRRGLFVWSPFLVVLVPGLRAAWRGAPGWVRGGGVGALLYLAIHWKANRFSGGEGFVGYRYPLEALMAAGPLLYLAYATWVAERRLAKRVFWVAAAVAVALQVSGAFR